MDIDKATKAKRREQSVLLALAPEAPISLAEAAVLASISLRHLSQERALGRGPTCYRLGEKAIRTTVGDVLAWVKSRAEVARP